jgi:hypothetical protein
MKKLRRLTLVGLVGSLAVAANSLAYAIGSLMGFFEYSLAWTISAFAIGGFAAYGAVIAERLRRTLKRER